MFYLIFEGWHRLELQDEASKDVQRQIVYLEPGKSARLPFNSLGSQNCSETINDIGGSSAINYHCWITPPAHDINVFENLGNPGWNWGNFSEYVKRAET